MVLFIFLIYSPVRPQSRKMKLEEAIPNLQRFDAPGTYTLDEDDIASIKLGEHAVKRIRNHRVNPNWKPETLLPGESAE